MKWLLTTLLCLLTIPYTASAAEFAKDSIFLSKTSVTEGETVLIHAVVTNAASTNFTGDLVLREGDVTVGTVPVKLGAQEAQAVSVSWKPVAGTHKIAARLVGKDGSTAEEQTATFFVNQKPLDSATSTPGAANGSTSVQSSEALQEQLSGISPEAASITKPFFTTIDSVRSSAANTLDKGIEWAKKKNAGPNAGDILNGTKPAEKGGALDTIGGILSLALLYLFNTLRYMIANPALFYPAFALLFIYTLWRIYKRMRRPRFPDYN